MTVASESTMDVQGGDRNRLVELANVELSGKVHVIAQQSLKIPGAVVFGNFKSHVVRIISRATHLRTMGLRATWWMVEDAV